MRKKKLLSGLLIGAMFLSGACSAHSAETESGSAATSAPSEAAPAEETTEPREEDSAETEISPKAAEETTAATEKSAAETEPAQKYTDENGLLNEAAKERIGAILAENPPINRAIYPGLFDFDRDGVPELYLVLHSGGQGFMPTVVYTLDGERLGEFEGYCRDGFCRFSVGEDCVYVHNWYEHSMHTSCDLVTRLTVEDGVLSAEEVLCQIGNVLDGESFPLKYYSYFVNGESAEKEAFDEAYTRWLFYTDEDVIARKANEVSICTYDLLFSNLPFSELPDDSERGEAVVSLYNQYIAGKNAATELFGKEPLLFAFDDYDGDGSYEAFAQAKNTEPIYFWNGTDFTEIDGSEVGGSQDYARIGGLLFVQPFGNGLPCSIYGVRDGEFYVHENSCCGMLIRTSEYFPYDHGVNGEYVLYDSTFELSHTHKPYFFEAPCLEIVGIPVTEEYFSDREDVLSALDELKAELSVYPENAEIVGMYLRGDRYLNVNYTVPVKTWDEEGDLHYYPLPYYRTYIVQNKAVQIDEGHGHYRASLCGESE